MYGILVWYHAWRIQTILYAADRLIESITNAYTIANKLNSFIRVGATIHDKNHGVCPSAPMAQASHLLLATIVLVFLITSTEAISLYLCSVHSDALPTWLS